VWLESSQATSRRTRRRAPPEAATVFAVAAKKIVITSENGEVQKGESRTAGTVAGLVAG